MWTWRVKRGSKDEVPTYYTTKEKDDGQARERRVRVAKIYSVLVNGSANKESPTHCGTGRGVRCLIWIEAKEQEYINKGDILYNHTMGIQQPDTRSTRSKSKKQGYLQEQKIKRSFGRDGASWPIPDWTTRRLFFSLRICPDLPC